MNLVKLHTASARVGILVATVQHGYRSGKAIITQAAVAADLADEAAKWRAAEGPVRPNPSR